MSQKSVDLLNGIEITVKEALPIGCKEQGGCAEAPQALLPIHLFRDMH